MFLLGLLTSGISNIVFSFIYNKIYVKNMLMNGYEVMKYENYNRDTLMNYTGLINVKETPGVISI